MDFLRSLALRAEESPEAPWLFYREGLDWRWRSYRRVADQVARSLARLGVGSGAEPVGAVDGEIPARPRQHPDAITAFLVLLASGRELDLTQDIGSPDWLAACRGSLDRFEAASLSPQDPSRLSAMPSQAAMRRFSLNLSRDAEHLSASLARPCLDLKERVILYAGAATSTSALAALALWALENDAAWALEFQADAFAATALWTRPHVLVASAFEARELRPLVGKSARRRSRLRALVIGGEEHLDHGLDTAELEEGFGCSVLRWPS